MSASLHSVTKPQESFLLVPTDALHQLVTLCEGIKSMLDNQGAYPLIDQNAQGLEFHKAYSVKETAHILGLSENTVYELSQEELPRVRRKGGLVGFLGINILRYMHNLPPIDVGAATEKYRESLMRESPNIHSLKKVEGKTRVH